MISFGYHISVIRASANGKAARCSSDASCHCKLFFFMRMKVFNGDEPSCIVLYGDVGYDSRIVQPS